jgi:hypothetical protein
MILFPLTYLLQGVVVGLAFRPEWVLWAYLLSLPLSAAFAWNYARFFNWFRRQFNYRRHCNKYTSAFQEARALWSKIDHWMEPLLMKLQ